MQEPMSSAPVEVENIEMDEEPVGDIEHLPAPPVDMETETSVIANLEGSPPNDHKIESPVPLFTVSSPLAKNANNSLDIIEILSAGSSPAPMIVENKENLEPQYENDEQAAIIRSLKKMIFSLKAKNLRDVSIAKKNTRRDVVDKMSANHQISISKERKNHFKLLRETRQLYEKRLSDVENFYVEKISILEENRTVAFDALLESKGILEDQIKKNCESLNSIVKIISSYPSNSPTTATKSLPDNENRESLIVEENSDEPKLSDKLIQLETEVYEQKLRITCLENKIKDEITSKGQIQQKLAYTEILYRTTIKEKDEQIKILQDDLTNLKNSKNEMEIRHKEQFLKYDRMLKRSQAEIAVQKREVVAMRTQFVPGTPTNFNSNKATSSIIKESTPSSSKMSSNITILDASGTKKAPLFEESTSSFCTAASNRSSLNQTPSSKASKSLRSRKAPSETSTNSSMALYNSDDSEEPKQKSSRVLRNRRKKAVKSRKRF